MKRLLWNCPRSHPLHYYSPHSVFPVGRRQFYSTTRQLLLQGGQHQHYDFIDLDATGAEAILGNHDGHPSGGSRSVSSYQDPATRLGLFPIEESGISEPPDFSTLHGKEKVARKIVENSMMDGIGGEPIIHNGEEEGCKKKGADVVSKTATTKNNTAMDAIQMNKNNNRQKETSNLDNELDHLINGFLSGETLDSAAVDVVRSSKNNEKDSSLPTTSSMNASLVLATAHGKEENQRKGGRHYWFGGFPLMEGGLNEMNCSSSQESTQEIMEAAAAVAGRVEVEAGDWICPQCMTHNFRRRVNCFGCGAVQKEKQKTEELEKKNENASREKVIATGGSSKVDETDNLINSFLTEAKDDLPEKNAAEGKAAKEEKRLAVMTRHIAMFENRLRKAKEENERREADVLFEFLEWVGVPITLAEIVQTFPVLYNSISAVQSILEPYINEKKVFAADVTRIFPDDNSKNVTQEEEGEKGKDEGKRECVTIAVVPWTEHFFQQRVLPLVALAVSSDVFVDVLPRLRWHRVWPVPSSASFVNQNGEGDNLHPLEHPLVQYLQKFHRESIEVIYNKPVAAESDSPSTKMNQAKETFVTVQRNMEVSHQNPCVIEIQLALWHSYGKTQLHSDWLEGFEKLKDFNEETFRKRVMWEKRVRRQETRGRASHVVEVDSTTPMGGPKKLSTASSAVSSSGGKRNRGRGKRIFHNKR